MGTNPLSALPVGEERLIYWLISQGLLPKKITVQSRVNLVPQFSKFPEDDMSDAVREALLDGTAPELPKENGRAFVGFLAAEVEVEGVITLHDDGVLLFEARGRNLAVVRFMRPGDEALRAQGEARDIVRALYGHTVTLSDGSDDPAEESVVKQDGLQAIARKVGR